MSTVDPCRMPHWLTPVCDDHPVSQPTSTWLPSRIQRCRVGTSPERSARRSTAWATPSSWMNTTPGTSVTTASFDRRRACRATRWSSHELSSMASSALTIVVTITRPTTTPSAVQNPSISTPGSRSSSRNTNRALRTIAPSPSVSTESGTTRNASAGQTTALATPTTKPASNASHERVDREARQDRGEQPQRECGDDRDDDGCATGPCATTVGRPRGGRPPTSAAAHESLPDVLATPTRWPHRVAIVTASVVVCTEPARGCESLGRIPSVGYGLDVARRHPLGVKCDDVAVGPSKRRVRLHPVRGPRLPLRSRGPCWPTMLTSVATDLGVNRSRLLTVPRPSTAWRSKQKSSPTSTSAPDAPARSTTRCGLSARRRRRGPGQPRQPSPAWPARCPPATRYARQDLAWFAGYPWESSSPAHGPQSWTLSSGSAPEHYDRHPNRRSEEGAVKAGSCSPRSSSSMCRGACGCAAHFRASRGDTRIRDNGVAASRQGGMSIAAGADPDQADWAVFRPGEPAEVCLRLGRSIGSVLCWACCWRRSCS